MVSGSPDVSNSCVFPCSASCVSLSGWWCRALRTSPIHFLPPVEIRLPPLIAVHLSLSLADCVRLFRCFSLFVFHPFVVGPTSLVFHSCLPVWLVVSGALDVRRHLFQNSYLSPDACLHLSPFICLPVWLVVSGSSGACLHVSFNLFASQSRMSVFMSFRIYSCLPVQLSG